MAVAAMVFGILSLIGGFIPILNYFTWLFGISGIIMSVIARKKAKQMNQSTDLATGALIVSIIGTVVGLSFFFACVLCLAVCASIGAAGAAGF
jgi:uncharacterized membrane protein